MASRFENVEPTIRDLEIEGYSVRVTIGGNGVSFIRKGNRKLEKAKVSVTWTQIAEIGAEKDPGCEGRSFYEQLGFDS